MRFPHALMGLAALLALAACTRLGEVEPPQVHLADIRLLPGGLLEQRFQVDLRFGNPNDFDLALDGLTFELELNDMAFARGLSDQAVTVPRLGETRLRVVASTTLIDVVQQMLVLGERSDLSYRIAGVVYLRGAGARKLPYETAGRLRLLPAQPD
ncbi:MAG: LEA type 2 family protein [Kiloniellales bacterium]